MLSVPEHNSSPNTKLFLSANLKIVLNSDISTANVDNPLNILSFPNILVKIYLYGLYSNDEAGTYNPACAIIVAIPNALMKLVLPTALVP